MHFLNRFLSLGALAAASVSVYAGIDAQAYFNNLNPNGPFRYSGGIAAPGLMTNYGSAAGVTGGQNFWGFGPNPATGPNPYSLVYKTWNTDQLTVPGGDVVPRGQLCAHPGSVSGQGMIRFDGPGANYRPYVQFWRPSPLGDGASFYIKYGNNSIWLQTGPNAPSTRGYPWLFSDPAIPTIKFFEIAAWTLTADITYDTICINASVVDLTAPGPRVHGIAWLYDFVGKTEEVAIDVQVRDAGNAVIGAGSGMLMSTGQFDVNFTLFESPMFNGGYTTWLKPKGRLARKLTGVPFTSSVGDTITKGTAFFGGPSMIDFKGGDIDNDNEVSILDYLALSAFLGQQRVTSIPAWTAFNATYGCSAQDADIDGDDEVSILDYLILSANFGLQGDL